MVVVQWIQSNATVILAGLFFLSEGLALIPQVKANSVFQLIFGWLQKEQTPPSA